ncbi:hypothetical protein CRP01_26375 [Flavilitoribacter nigricans DSM 23189 = NBRC 102662]|uniref:Uncharacterized protein n=1 Tax=Flavilitoribacter nigricans (strain ATCC 23147 / DSM 23189 / NBRC 102662 / NCIMB 1420 / SS-2) TaxID=1122177 RepID=A0A2D0N559_FLAN2|nr:hypothetical protein CRP01_26375 [Flavilitoribacter nigricans DSM 23189 = NBRC 102662]
MNIKNGNFNGNSNFNNSTSGEKVKIGAESCLLLAIAIVLDIVIEKFALRFYRTEQPCPIAAERNWRIPKDLIS